MFLHLPIEKNFRVPDWRELAARDFDYDTTRYYSLRVENQGPRIRAYIDGRLILEANDGEILKGKAGISAASPARFQQFRLEAPEAAASAIKKRIAAREQELARLRAENPQPVLWKKFATPRFGAGRNVRFGDLNGDGRIDMLIAQNIPRVTGDSFVQISCLTAIDLDGKVLWQSGQARPRQWTPHQ